jgi:hypothetical protein
MIWLLSWRKKQQQQHGGLSDSWLDNRICQKSEFFFHNSLMLMTIPLVQEREFVFPSQ